MADEPGFEIAGQFYGFPSSFRLCDPVLVAEVTGLAWNDFAQLLDEQDPRTLAGLVAVGVWQKHPRWRRDKVIEFVQSVEMDALSFAGVDTPELPEGADAGPPEPSATTVSEPWSSTASADEKEASGETPEPTGIPASVIGVT